MLEEKAKLLQMILRKKLSSNEMWLIIKIKMNGFKLNKHLNFR